METWTKSHNVYDEQEEGENCDEFYQNSSTKKSHLSLALLDVEDDYTSCSSGDGSNSPHTLEDLLNWKMQEVIQF